MDTPSEARRSIYRHRSSPMGTSSFLDFGISRGKNLLPTRLEASLETGSSIHHLECTWHLHVECKGSLANRKETCTHVCRIRRRRQTPGSCTLKVPLKVCFLHQGHQCYGAISFAFFSEYLSPQTSPKKGVHPSIFGAATNFKVGILRVQVV